MNHLLSLNGQPALFRSVATWILLLAAMQGLQAAPVITAQPQSTTVVAGTNAAFAVTANGIAPLTYQWQRSTNNGSTWSNLTASATYVGPVTASLGLNAATTSLTSNQFRCMVTDSSGTATSDAGILTVNPAPGSPAFTTQPLAISVVAGTTASFTVIATGTAPLTYQWQRSINNGSSWSNLAADSTHVGTTAASLAVNNPTTGMNAYRFRCVVTNPVSTATSKSATLTVTATAIAPAITTQPQPVTVTAGTAVNFSVVASGSAPFGYQWQLNGVAISGATDANYSISRATKSRAGSYTVTVSNSGGSIVSAPAALIVLASTNSDFNSDGQSDILWQNTVTGGCYVWLMNGTSLASTAYMGAISNLWHICGTGDFNSDGQADIIWQNSTTGESKVWLMNGATLGSEVSLGVRASEWLIVGAGDFNGDGQSDILWWNRNTGASFVWLMNGTVYQSSVYIVTLPREWHIAGTGDFNGDGETDILWENGTTGERKISLMHGVAPSSEITLGIVAPALKIAMIGDYNGDGKVDIVWQDTSTGERAIWLMNGTQMASNVSLGSVALDWSIGSSVPSLIGTVPSAANALNIFWQNTATGDSSVWLLNGASFVSSASLAALPPAWRIASAGDFNGDGQPDLLWRNTATGDVALWLMDGTSLQQGIVFNTVPLVWQIDGVADFNADGHPDILWRNTATGDVALWLMNGTTFQQGFIFNSIPLVWQVAGTGDFNGDGQTDILWRNMSSGDLALWVMNGTRFQQGFVFNTVPLTWRIAGAADFNGDGKTDILWSNTSSGDHYVWYMNGTNLASSAFIGSLPPEWRIAAASVTKLTSTPTAAASESEASRFLIQSSFGPTAASIARVRSVGYAGWLNEQMALPPTYHLPYYQARAAELFARDGSDGYFTPRQEAWWQHALTAPDQLRQRMAFALSEILVISQDSKLDGEHAGVTAYYDLLVKHAFGNYRQLLEEVTLSPMMGTYLSMIRNRKPDPKTGSQPDENYAREIMQLFSLGLSELNLDGTLRLSADGQPIPTYVQSDIVGLAHVFTGWGPHYDPASPPKWSNGTTATANDWFLWGWDPLQPMTFNTKYGDLQARQIVRGVTVPGTLTGPQRLTMALDTLFNHPNVAPFIARQLIQRFVTSNPGQDYIKRVASAFNDNGTGVRGDLGATLRAVLLDPDARGPEKLTDNKSGKLVEPLLRLTRMFRAFPPAPPPHAAVGDNRLFLNFVWEMPEQSPLMAPSVFNFFKPGFAQPGRIAAAGLVSPEFQIFNDTTAVSGANLNYSKINWGITVDEPSGTNSYSSMDLDLTEPLGILMAPGLTHAEAQAALVEYFNRRLLGGNMSAFLRQKILDTYTSLPKWFDYSAASELERVQTGLYLVLFSPEFNIQR